MKKINNVRLDTNREVSVELCTKNELVRKICRQIANKPPLHITQLKSHQTLTVPTHSQ